jgi:hypothetical protein
MSAWRRKALEALPELRSELEQPGLSLYEAFFEIVPLCHKAHIEGNMDLLTRIYRFAAWCSRQPDPALWNPVGVAFYEHLADSGPTLKAIPDWVPRDVFDNVASLLEARVGKATVDELRSRYKK